MDIIKDKDQAINALNEVLFTEGAVEIAGHLDDIIFDYVAHQATGGRCMSEYENDRVMTARLVRDLFYSLKNNSNLIKNK